VVPSTKRQHSATAYDLQSTNERTPFTADLALRLILTGKPTLPLAQTHSASRSNPLYLSLKPTLSLTQTQTLITGVAFITSHVHGELCHSRFVLYSLSHGVASAAVDRACGDDCLW
jgi:hypothetical protein